LAIFKNPADAEEAAQEAVLKAFLTTPWSPSFRLGWKRISEWARIARRVLDGTRNVVKLMADGIEYQMPEGFSRRLFDRIKKR